MKIYKAFFLCELIYISSPLLISQRSDWGNVQAKSDDACVPVTLSEPIQLWGNNYQTLYVSNNGGIFTQSYTTMILANPWSSFPSDSFLVYWADTNYLRQCSDGLCGMYINKNPSDTVLSLINNLIKNGFSANVQRTLIVTWYKAPPYISTSANQFLENTFQTVLTSDGRSTYFIVSYDNITYPRISDGTAKIGFYQNSVFRIVFPGSENLNNAKSNLNCQSNVDFPGVYAAGMTSISGYQVSTNAGVSRISSSCSTCQGDNLLQCFQPNILEISPSFTYVNIVSSGVADSRLAWLSSLNATVTTYSGEDKGTSIQSADIARTSQFVDRISTPSPGPFVPFSTSFGTPLSLAAAGTSSISVVTGGSQVPKTPYLSTFLPSGSKAIDPSVATSSITSQIVVTTPQSTTNLAGCFNNGGCSDVCNFFNNSVVCSCSNGVLASDNRTCYDNTEFIYASLSNSVLKWNNYNDLPPINGFGIDTNDAYIVAMDHDYKNQLFYYSRNTANISTISVMNIDGSNKQALLTVNGTVNCMAYDWTRNYLFYADKLNGIFSLDLNSKVLIPVLVSRTNSSSLVYPIALVLENCERSLFVTYWGENGGYISRFFFNNTMMIVVKNLVYPSTLAIDRQNRKLYWADMYLKRIESSNYDASCRQVIAFFNDNLMCTSPTSMLYWNNSLFWTNCEYLYSTGPNSIMVTNIQNKLTSVFKNIGSRGYVLGFYQDKTNGLCDSIPVCETIPFLPVYPTSKQPLLPYGDKLDRKLPLGDGGGAEFVLSQYIPLFLNYPSRNKIFINVDGFIFFNNVYSRPDVNGIEPFLAVYTADFNTRRFGNVYYRESVDPLDLLNITNLLRNKSLEYSYSLFNASHLVIVTWDMVSAFYNPNLMSTFQAVIASDDKRSILINLYQRLDLYGGLVGFNNGLSCAKILSLNNTELIKYGNVVFNLSECLTSPTTQRPSTTSSAGGCFNNGRCSNQSLLPFGDKLDRKLPLSDDGGAEFVLSQYIPLFLNYPSRNRFFINVNGIISFNGVYSSGYVNSIEPLLAVYVADLNIMRVGNVYYRESVDPLDIMNVTNILKSKSFLSNDSLFNASHLVIVTWYMVPAYANFDLISTFQSVIASDNKRSFLINLYQRLDLNGGQVGFTNGLSCSFFPTISNTDLIKYGIVVFNLSECSTSSTQRPSTTSYPGCFNNGGCSDICNFLNNNVVCSCTKGVLASDNRTCYDNTEFIYASLSNSVLIWSNNIDLPPIYGFGIDTNDADIVAMDHDYKNQLFYYSRNTVNTSTISVMSIDGSNKQALLTLNGSVNCMAYDWTRNYLFYADELNGIFLLDLNSEVLIPVLVSRSNSSLIVYPRAMVLENCGRSLFVTFWGVSGGYVGRFFLNNTMTVVAGNIYPNSLAIDRINRKLYWADTYSKRIESSNFDGSCRQMIAFVNTYFNPLSMFYWNNSLFWINGASINSWQNSIMVTNIWNKQTVVFKNIISRGYALNLYQNKSYGLCESILSCEKIPYPNSTQPLLPFGDKLDRKLPPSDDGGAEFILTRYIPLFLNYPSKNKVFINVNGIISINSVYTSYTVILNEPLLGVYFADFNIIQAGNVYYRESVDPLDLMNFSNLLRSKLLGSSDSLFNASHLVIVTWYMVPAYRDSSLRSTFQSIVASDDKRSFYINLYQRLDIAGGQVGFNNGFSCRYFPPLKGSDLLSYGSVVFDLLECLNSSATQRPTTTSYPAVCINFTCAEELACQLNSNLEPYCGCKSSCERSSPVCGLNLVTYASLCYMQIIFCKEFGNDSSTWPGMAYEGACQQYPYLTGMVMLDPIQGAPGTFCKNVVLVSNFFYKLDPLQVILTLSWESDISREATHDASAVWSENVTVNGFRACALVAGRHFFDFLPSPYIYWGAFQKGIFAPGLFEGGIIKLPSWATGSQCTTLVFSATPKLMASVSLNSTSYTDALTIWVERYQNSLMHKICVQELQNFDGVHEGVQIHYIALYSNGSLFPEVGDIVLASFNFVGPTLCSVTKYNSQYPKSPNPTVLATVASTSYYFSSDSSYNMAIWIERKNNTSIQFCVDSVDWKNAMFNTISLRYVIFPKFCDEGYYYFQSHCFKLLVNQYTYDQAQLQCSSLNASLPTINSISWNYFLVSLASSTVWLDFKKVDNKWKWNNENSSFRNSSFTNWAVGKPSGNGNCSVSNGTQGWSDVSCSQSYNVVCYKDAQISLLDCSVTCQNGLCKINNLGIVKCNCLPGFIGTWCEEKIPDGCQNYVMLNQSWRRYNNNSLPSTPLNNSCDNMLAGNGSLWIRFSPESGGRLWDLGCIDSQNYCGVKYPGWLSVPHPTPNNRFVTATLHFYSYYCASDAGLVRIINCDGYYVYNFVRIPFWSCDYGVCTV